MTIGPCLERRKHPRFRIEGRAYAANTDRPGLIADISLGGVSWHYIDRKLWPEPLPPTLDLLIEGREAALTGLPCRVIADVEAEHDGPDTSLALRRRSVQFGPLTAEQQALLEEIIRRHAAAPLQTLPIPN
ncbi:MAG: PilZ domain-containing protein [Desulfobacteraceae bacterium]|nr:PilZ domain-containing protein [Desulfobacteraceae bacterium]